MYGKLAAFLSIFQRVATFPVFCGVNHQKCLNFLFLPEICIYCVMIFEIKNLTAISGDPSKIYTVPLPLLQHYLKRFSIQILLFVMNKFTQTPPAPPPLNLLITKIKICWAFFVDACSFLKNLNRNLCCV